MAREAGAQGGNNGVRALVFLAFAVVAGSVSLLGLYQLITTYQKRIDEAKRPEDTVMVIVAARDLYQGVTVTEDDLYAVAIPPRYLPEGVFLSPEHVVGRIPRERILANEFVRIDRLADPESGIGLNAVIPRGFRAISINISDGQALSGFLDPDNYVDILVTIKPEPGSDVMQAQGGNQPTPETKMLLQAVYVLGVNSRMGDESADEAKARRGHANPTVTLLASAEEAEQIAHAEQMGDITLALRNDQDVEEVATIKGVTLEDLRKRLAKPAPVRVAAPKPKPVVDDSTTLTIIRGNEKTDQKVNADGSISKPQ